jgi:pyridoxal 5'-phosphate synthase pdxT subunit
VTLGVLALQGDFDAHAKALREAGAGDVREVRRTGELEGLSGLVMPGGESTTLLRLFGDEPWFQALQGFAKGGGALFGTCAGAILLAREVRAPAQPSLGLLDAVVERNAYGRQVDSFEAPLETSLPGGPLPAVFIRAPRLLDLGPRVEVLARHEGAPVLVRQDNLLAASFHPELSDDPRVPRLFVEMAGKALTGHSRK